MKSVAKPISFLFLLCIPIISYAAGNPVLYKKHFDFYTIGKNLKDTTFEWTMEFKNQDKKTVAFNNCNDISVFNYKNIAFFHRFHFKLFTADCTAIYKYLNAKASNISYFPNNFSDDFILSLPANIIPIINDHIFNKRKGKSIKQAFAVEKIQLRNKSHNILAPEDDLNIDILARGDFDNDGIEDLIITTAWYARNARGKFNDLVIVTKKAADKPMEITWRMHGSVYGPDPGTR